MNTMLEITILKTQHAFGNDARKLLPYIQQCDVFTPERSLNTETKAREAEQEWQRIINSGMTRTRYRQLNWHPVDSHEYNEFRNRLNEDLFRERKPVWYLERFSEQEAQKWKTHFEQNLERYETSMDKLADGEVSEFLRVFRQHQEKLIEFMQARDKHIAQNLRRAEQRIRTEYPILAQKEPLKFAVSIGCLHRVEDYIEADLEVKIIEVPITFGNADAANAYKCSGKIANALFTNDIYDGFDRDLLEMALCVRRVDYPELPLPEEQLKNKFLELMHQREKS